MSKLAAPAQRVFTHTFEVGAAVMWTLVGFAWALDQPGTALHSPIMHQIGWWSWFWTVLYIVSGPLVIYGVLRHMVNLRVGGLMLLMTGLTIQFIAALRGPVDIRAFVYLVYAVACGLKLIMLHGIYHKGRAYKL